MQVLSPIGAGLSQVIITNMVALHVSTHDPNDKKSTARFAPPLTAGKREIRKEDGRKQVSGLGPGIKPWAPFHDPPNTALKQTC